MFSISTVIVTYLITFWEVLFFPPSCLNYGIKWGNFEVWSGLQNRKTYKWSAGLYKYCSIDKGYFLLMLKLEFVEICVFGRDHNEIVFSSFFMFQGILIMFLKFFVVDKLVIYFLWSNPHPHYEKFCGCN